MIRQQKTGAKLFSLMKPLPTVWDNRLSGEEKVNSTVSPVVGTVKYSETIHV